MLAFLWSILLWCLIVLAITGWTLAVSVSCLFERDKLRRRTGRWFRNLGIAVTRFSPGWRVHQEGVDNIPAGTYLVVSNHQSSADIPLLCFLPFEMKWLAKKTLFHIPGFGWMMRMAGDIPVDRSNRRQGARALMKAAQYLSEGMNILVFPEGTRSRDGELQEFHDAPFRLAVKQGVPVLPVVLDGTAGCLLKGSWRFSPRASIHLKVCPPIPVAGLRERDAAALRDAARKAIADQLAAWRARA